MDIVEAKEIVFEYFNHYKTSQEIDELFQFLDLHSTDTFQSKEIVLICCYAERYFLHQNETVTFQRPLQEIIDFEFLKRKFDGLKLTDSLRRVLKTLYEQRYFMIFDHFYSFFRLQFVFEIIERMFHVFVELIQHLPLEFLVDVVHVRYFLYHYFLDEIS